MSLMPAPQPGWVPSDSFALRLVMARFQAGGISQEEAASRCQLKASTWATWENGTKPRRMDEIVALIAEGIGCDRGWLMFGGPVADSGPNNPGPSGGAAHVTSGNDVVNGMRNAEVVHLLRAITPGYDRTAA